MNLAVYRNGLAVNDAMNYIDYVIKRGFLMHLRKNIDPCQPAQSAQADMGRNFSLSINFLHVKGPFYIIIQSVV